MPSPPEHVSGLPAAMASVAEALFDVCLTPLINKCIPQDTMLVLDLVRAIFNVEQQPVVVISAVTSLAFLKCPKLFLMHALLKTVLYVGRC